MINDITSLFTDHYDLAAIGAFLTFLTILFTFYNQVGIPMYKATLAPIVDFFGAVASSPTRINHLDTKLDLILAELKPNGGSSLKDQMNRLEASVSISEAQRLLILDNSQQGVWTSNTEGDCTWINQTLANKVGGSLHDFQGENWISTIHPQDRKIVEEEWNAAIKNQRTFNLFYRFQNLNTQDVINVHGVATPAKNYDGSIVGYNGVIYFL